MMMKRKIHKNDRPIVERMYTGLLSFCTQEYFHTCDTNLSEMPIWNVLDKQQSKGYAVHAFCSFQSGDEDIVALESKDEVMLRLYNITLDAFKLLGESGQMDTFLGIPAIGKNYERHIWIRIYVIQE